MTDVFRVLAFLAPAGLGAQVSLQVSLPRAMVPSSAHELRVRIGKGPVTDYSKLELRFPEGSNVQAGDVMGGTFSFENGHAKLIWPMTPEQDTLEVSMRLTAPPAPGEFSLQTGYYYLSGDSKNELKGEPFTFRVGEVAEPADSSLATVQTQTVADAAVPTTSANTSVKDPELRKMLPHQLRRDSREALTLGETEKAKARENLDDANTILRQIEYLDDAELREKITRKVSGARRRAERDLETAEKILALARSLEEEADRIQKELSGGNGGASSPEPSAAGLVYRIQVGAFTKKPSPGEFRSLGNVSIFNEAGLYKVLTGEFPTRESAKDKRDELRQKGFDAFVVGYKDGKRVE